MYSTRSSAVHSYTCHSRRAFPARRDSGACSVCARMDGKNGKRVNPHAGRHTCYERLRPQSSARGALGHRAAAPLVRPYTWAFFLSLRQDIFLSTGHQVSEARLTRRCNRVIPSFSALPSNTADPKQSLSIVDHPVGYSVNPRPDGSVLFGARGHGYEQWTDHLAKDHTRATSDACAAFPLYRQGLSRYAEDRLGM